MGAHDSTQALIRYFSLGTITSVGYGDITPATSAARSFANLESVVGHPYLVIQVAWLVGMHESMKSKWFFLGIFRFPPVSAARVKQPIYFGL